MQESIPETKYWRRYIQLFTLRKGTYMAELLFSPGAIQAQPNRFTIVEYTYRPQ